MQPYQPHLIANMRTGLELGIKPWLVPMDAFVSLENCFLRDGALEKRKGYLQLATTGDGHEIVGIMNHVKADGTDDLMVHDTRRLFKFSGGALVDQDGSDQLTGNSGNLISWCNYGGKLYMTNDNDRPRVWDGSTVANVTVDISGDAANELTRATLLAVSHERVIFIGVTESGTHHPQRARWCVAETPTDWTNDGYVDAPTGEWARAYDELGDDLIVWFDDSVWWLRYTADADLPFRWERISSEFGCVGTAARANIMAKPIALAPIGFVTTDGLTARRFDARIPDMVMQFDANNAAASVAYVVGDDRQLWLLHPSSGQTTPDRAVVLNYEDGSWSQADMAMTCFGSYRQGTSVIWSAASGAWEDQAEVWVAGRVQAGYPIPLVGDAAGAVHRFSYTKNDNGTAIRMTAKTGRMNPYAARARKARLGKVEILADAEGAITVDVLLDSDTVPAVSVTLDLTDTTHDRDWHTVPVGTIANFHTLRFTNSATGQRPIIHAIVPWFRPVGRFD